MPTYGYHCTSCGKKVDIFQKITDAPITLCEACGKQTLQRGPGGGIGLSFTGSGFYINDYGSKQQQSGGTNAGEDGGGCCPCGKNKGPCGSN